MLFSKYYQGQQIKENEMGRACAYGGGGREMHSGFWWGILKERDHLEDLDIDGRIKLTLIIKK
jgi:hypothetical protein